MSGDDELNARHTLGEMYGRISQGPHSALGVSATATADDVRAAFLSLTKQFHPARFGRMSSELQKLANEVFLGIKMAHDQLVKSLGGSVRGAKSANQSGGMPLMGADGTARTAMPVRGPTATAGTVPPGRPATPPVGAPVMSRTTTPVVQARTMTPVTPAAARTTTPVSPVASRTMTPVTPGANGRPVTPAPIAGARPATPPAGGARPATPPAGVRPAAGARPITPAPVAGARPGAVPAAGARAATPTPTAAGRPTPTPAPTPGFDQRMALRNCQILLAQQEWGRARMALQELVANVPSATTYHAMLAYARGREAAAAGRTQDALLEYQRALELNPAMAEANQAAAELQRRR